MLKLVLAVSLLQMLYGLDAYVVLQQEHPWRAAPVPQYYYYYHPYYWTYPYPASNECAELRHNQKIIIDILKCLTTQDAKESCKKLLDVFVLMKTPTKKPESAIFSPPSSAPVDTSMPAAEMGTEKAVSEDSSPMVSKQEEMTGDSDADAPPS